MNYQRSQSSNKEKQSIDYSDSFAQTTEDTNFYRQGNDYKDLDYTVLNNTDNGELALDYLDQTIFEQNDACKMYKRFQGLDDQGIKWTGLRFSRQQFKDRRQRNYQSYRNNEMVLNKQINNQQREIVKPNATFYKHKMTKRDERINVGHFQLLRNLKAVSPYDVYFAVSQGIAYFNSKKHDQKHPIIVKVISDRFLLTTFDVIDEFFALGSYDGKVYICSNAEENISLREHSIAVGEGMIVNCIQFLPASKQQPLRLMTSCNDCSVKIFDFETMKTMNKFQFKDPINIAQCSPDGNYIGVYGDCLQAEIVDLRSEKLVASLYGHEDFGFSFAWHPSQLYIATGNQDRTCKIWDVRYLKNNQHGFTQNNCHCIQTINCEIGQSADIKFVGSTGDQLIFSESIDYLQIYDTKTYQLHQEIDLFGEIAGFDVYENKLFIALRELPNLSCIMEYVLDQSIDEEFTQPITSLIL